MQIVKLPIEKLEANTGQIPDLPMNPRQWTQTDIDSLAKSLTETPELFEARPLLVVPFGDKFVILGGNLRYEAAKHNGEKEVPCIAFPKNMPVEKMKEIVVKDNGSFGAWDWDALANEWDDLPLKQWGVPAWTVEEEVEEVKKDKDVAAQVPFTEILNEEHNYIVLFFDNEVDWLQAQTLFDIRPVKALPTKRSGEQSEAFQKRIGVGRVLNGAKAIQKIISR